jgi:hypothetical protein
MWIFLLVSYVLQKHYKTIISYFVGCQALVNMNTRCIFFAICRLTLHGLFLLILPILKSRTPFDLSSKLIYLAVKYV